MPSAPIEDAKVKPPASLLVETSSAPKPWIGMTAAERDDWTLALIGWGNSCRANDNNLIWWEVIGLSK